MSPYTQSPIDHIWDIVDLSTPTPNTRPISSGKEIHYSPYLVLARPLPANGDGDQLEGAMRTDCLSTAPIDSEGTSDSEAAYHHTLPWAK
jgi:hypothetical protein